MPGFLETVPIYGYCICNAFYLLLELYFIDFHFTWYLPREYVLTNYTRKISPDINQGLRGKWIKGIHPPQKKVAGPARLSSQVTNFLC